MRKRTIQPVGEKNIDSDQNWLDVDKLAIAEVTSEDDGYPIESALLPGGDSGWRASGPGKQVIRLLFDNPQDLQRIRLKFEELEIERTQEYVLRWSPDGGRSYRDIIRQQWNFSPDGATSQIEEYQVELSAVSIVELSINPDIGSGSAVASVKELRVA